MLLLCACMAGTATATETAKFHVSFFPYKLGATTTIRIDAKFGTTSGQPPGPLTNFDMRIPASLELINSTLGLAVCQPGKLADVGLPACPVNAQIGTGSAAVIAPFGPELLGENAEISIFMAPPVGEDIGVVLFVEGRSPILAQLIFPGVVLVGSRSVGETLNTTLPLTPTLPGAPDAAVIGMKLNIGPEHLTYYKRVHGRRVGYSPEGIALPKTCPRGGFPFVADMTFQDGTHLTVPTPVPCPTRRQRHH